MKKKNGDSGNVVNLDLYRKDKFALNIRVGGYYANRELGVYLHVVGITIPMHTKDSEEHYIVEDHFGNLVTFSIDDPPENFIYSSIEEFAVASMSISEIDDSTVS
jgi:hypothetical protein